MEASSPRRTSKHDPAARLLRDDPELQEVLRGRHEDDPSNEQLIESALGATQDKKLCGWVAVALWEADDGELSSTIVGDAHSSPLELKGYLHDAIWSVSDKSG